MKLIKNFYNFIGIKRFIIIIIVLLIFISMFGLGLTKYSDTLSDSGSIIKVGSLSVPSKLFMAEYNLILQQNAAALSQNPYATENILKGMISRYVSTLIFVNEANYLHLGASDDLVYKIIAGTPYFKGEDGKFNQDLFKKSVSQIYGSPEAYIATLKNDLKQSQLTGSLVTTLYQPTKLNKYTLNALGQTRTINYIVFSRDEVNLKTKPTDKELMDLLNKNKDVYTDQEYRSLQILSVNIADYLQQAQVTNQEIEAYYNANKSKYVSEETRDISQILVDNENEANKLYNQLKNNTSLTNKEVSVTSLSSVTKQSLPPSMINNVFNAPLNIVQKPLKTELGYQIVLVTKINSASPLALKDVTGKIKAELVGNKMSALYENLKTNLDAASKSGQSLDNISKKFKAKLVTVNDINKFGFDNKNNVVAGATQNKDILDAAFSLPINQTSNTIISQNNFYIVKIIKITPSHLQSFAEAKPQLLKQWQYNKASTAIQQQAEQAVATYAKKSNFTGLPFKVQTIALSREKAQKNNPFNNYAMDQLFLSKTNNPVQGLLDNNNIYVAVVAKINNSPAKLQDKQLDQLNQYIGNAYNQDILTELFNSLNKKYNVKVNQKALTNQLGNRVANN